MSNAGDLSAAAGASPATATARYLGKACLCYCYHQKQYPNLSHEFTLFILPAKFRSKVLAIGANLYKRHKIDVEGVMDRNPIDAYAYALIFNKLGLIFGVKIMLSDRVNIVLSEPVFYYRISRVRKICRRPIKNPSAAPITSTNRNSFVRIWFNIVSNRSEEKLAILSTTIFSRSRSSFRLAT